MMENTEKENKIIPRFRKITDKNIIAELEKIKGELY